MTFIVIMKKNISIKDKSKSDQIKAGIVNFLHKKNL